MSNVSNVSTLSPETSAMLEGLVREIAPALEAEANLREARGQANRAVNISMRQTGDKVITILRHVMDAIPVSTVSQKGFGVKDALSLLSFNSGPWQTFQASRSVAAAWSREKKQRNPEAPESKATANFLKALKGLVEAGVITEAQAAEVPVLLGIQAPATTDAEEVATV